MPKTKRKAPGFSHDSEILHGMSRGVWASHWADEQEEKGKSVRGGTDLYEVAPKTPGWAMKWANKLAGTIQHLNGIEVDELFEMARNAGFKKDKESFGFYLGMQAVGSGVHWTDDLTAVETPTILVPDYEFYKGAELHDPDIRFVKR